MTNLRSFSSILTAVSRRLGLSSRTEIEVSGEKPASWYDARYEHTASRTAHYTQSMYYFLWSVIVDRLPSDPKILEVGCGTGHLAHLLQDRQYTDYVGFDFSAEAIRVASARLPARRFHHADALTTPLLEGPYNTLICTEVLEHIPDDLRIIERIRPGTRCLVTVPNFPYVSHVRHFMSAQEVSNRYGSFFEPCNVSWLLLKQSGDGFFLLDGTRK
jgi:2-polyprenyl-3-methyl-5-hydroxy-6-metoxy-1,4-benzoquinol methylase